MASIDAGISSKSGGEAPKRKFQSGWNWHPDLPLFKTPLAQWPLQPFIILKMVLGGWLPISQKLIVAGIAVLTWFYLTPSLEQTQSFAPGWIAFIFFRNLVMFTLLAGGLHLYFYTFSRQGRAFRYDKREFQRGKRFTFGRQTWDNVFWSLASGVPVWTAFEVVGLWAFANGFMPHLAWADNPVWFLLVFVVLALVGNIHFYWIHRLIHWKPLYDRVHHLHHRNVVCGPWSGLSMHPIEHVLYFSHIVIHFVIASHPIHFLFSLQVKSLLAPPSHVGYEKIAKNEEAEGGVPVGDFYHQLHHRFFECNYGEPELPFDHWFGTHHDGTPEATKRMQARMSKRRAPRP